MASSIIFIDGTNLDHRLWDFFGRNDVDFIKFFAAVSQGTQLDHVHYCSAPFLRGKSKMKKQTSDFNFLSSQSNVTLHYGRFQRRFVTCQKCNNQYTSHSEKRTDVLVATLLVDAAFHKRADRLILVSNDNDFEPAIQMARQHGVEVHTALAIAPHDPDDPYSSTRDQLAILSPLRRYANRYIMLNEVFMDGCWRK